MQSRAERPGGNRDASMKGGGRAGQSLLSIITLTTEEELKQMSSFKLSRRKCVVGILCTVAILMIAGASAVGCNGEDCGGPLRCQDQACDGWFETFGTDWHDVCVVGYPWDDCQGYMWHCATVNDTFCLRWLHDIYFGNGC